jgi:hypothetical protein
VGNPDLESSATSFYRLAEGESHANWILGNGNGGVDQNGVRPQFQRFGGVAWRS